MRISRRANLLSAPVAEGVVILNPDTDVYYNLNETAARLWNLIEEPVNLASLVQVLSAEFEVAQTTCESALVEFIQSETGSKLFESARVR